MTPSAIRPPASPREKAIQFEMDFLLAHCYPLITAEEAAFLLDCHTTTVENLIDEGTLPAVNVALATETRRLLRVWRWAALHLCLSPETKMQSPGIEGALPHSRDLWLIREIAGLFRVSQQHVLNLYGSDLLAGPDRHAANKAHGRSPRIWKHSLITLLQTRHIA